MQEAPFCVQIELTEGCNLRCDFCGIQGIRAKAGGPFKYLTPALATTIAGHLAAARWNSRIEFAMHGEPTRNPDMLAIVAAFRKALPRNQLMMTSNGGGLLHDPTTLIDGLFDAGLNILALDNYKSVPIVPKILERYAGTRPVYSYPEDGLNYSPHRRWPARSQVVIIIQDLIEAAAGSHAVITNHCGCGAPVNQTKAGQRCAKPFREFSVRWDGSVAGCCNDWRGLYHIGTTATTDAETLWQGEAFQAMRRKLYAGERDFGACDGCDYSSYRNGLLPDKMGKQTLPPPDKATAAAIKRATRGPSYTPAVILEWEK